MPPETLHILGVGDAAKEEIGSKLLPHRDLLPEHLSPTRCGSKGNPITSSMLTAKWGCSLTWELLQSWLLDAPSHALPPLSPPVHGTAARCVPRSPWWHRQLRWHACALWSVGPLAHDLRLCRHPRWLHRHPHPRESAQPEAEQEEGRHLFHQQG